MSNLINVADWDRGIRLLAGVLLAAVGLLTAVIPSPWNWVAAAFGLVFVVTGAVGVCPLYMLFNFRTVRK